MRRRDYPQMCNILGPCKPLSKLDCHSMLYHTNKTATIQQPTNPALYSFPNGCWIIQVPLYTMEYYCTTHTNIDSLHKLISNTVKAL